MLGLGYGLGSHTLEKPRTPATGMRGLMGIQTPLETASTCQMLPAVTSSHLHHTRKWAQMLVFECFHLSLPPPFLPTFTWSPSPPQTLEIDHRARLGKWVCSTHCLNKVCVPSNIVNIYMLISFPTAHRQISTPATDVFSGSRVANHPQKRDPLVFDGGWLFFNTTTPPPSKTSIHAHFEWWLVVFRHHHSITIENEHTCSFSIVIVCLSTPLSHHP